MSLIETRVNDMREAGHLGMYENQESNYGALRLFVDQSNVLNGIITEDFKNKASKSTGTTLQIQMIDYGADVTISNRRPAIIEDNVKIFVLKEITFKTYSWGFTIVPASHANNESSIQEEFAAKFKTHLNTFYNELDTDAVAALNSSKTQVVEDLIVYKKVANTVQVEYKKREDIIDNVSSLMKGNGFGDKIDIVGNAGIRNIINESPPTELYDNNVNKKLYFTNRLNNASGEVANMFAVNSRSLGLLTRYGPEEKLATSLPDGTEWGKLMLPVGLEVGTHYYNSVGDASTTSGASSAHLTRVRIQHYMFSVDLAFVTPYNSKLSTVPSPIMKLTIKKDT